MECVSGGELFDRIVEKSYYNEAEARGVCKILLEAIGYCHEHHVAHRDLKPENLLLRSKDDDSSIKIADFGFAKIVDKKGSLTTQCGTPVSSWLLFCLCFIVVDGVLFVILLLRGGWLVSKVSTSCESRRGKESRGWTDRWGANKIAVLSFVLFRFHSSTSLPNNLENSQQIIRTQLIFNSLIPTTNRDMWHLKFSLEHPTMNQQTCGVSGLSSTSYLGGIPRSLKTTNVVYFVKFARDNMNSTRSTGEPYQMMPRI